MKRFNIPFIEKYRAEAWKLYNEDYAADPNWRFAILEALFRPGYVVPKGKGSMTHLHPDNHKFHLPEGCNVPDWRKYRVEDHPALIAFQKRCHAAGLHDPWLRNYAYNFYPSKTFRRTKFALGFKYSFRGILTGFSLYGLYAAYRHFFPTKLLHTPEYTAKYGDKEIYSH